MIDSGFYKIYLPTYMIGLLLSFIFIYGRSRKLLLWKKVHDYQKIYTVMLCMFYVPWGQ